MNAHVICIHQWWTKDFRKQGGLYQNTAHACTHATFVFLLMIYIPMSYGSSPKKDGVTVSWSQQWRIQPWKKGGGVLIWNCQINGFPAPPLNPPLGQDPCIFPSAQSTKADRGRSRGGVLGIRTSSPLLGRLRTMNKTKIYVDGYGHQRLTRGESDLTMQEIQITNTSPDNKHITVVFLL